MSCKDPVLLTEGLIEELRKANINVLHAPNTVTLPHDAILEPPCSLKWLRAENFFSIGSFSYAVSGYFFACSLGRYCSIGEEVQIGRHSHPLDFGSTSPIFYLDSNEVLGIDEHKSFGSQSFSPSRPPSILKKTYIGNDVYIGHGAFVMPGLTIGDGAVVGARSVVTRDVPPYAVVAGSPARILRSRFNQSVIDALLASEWWLFSPADLSIIDPANPLSFINSANRLREGNFDVFCPDKISLGLLSNQLRK